MMMHFRGGCAVPLGGDATPEDHNGGNTDSDFTSWTTDLEGVALDAAEEGNGPGIVLRKPLEDVRDRIAESEQMCMVKVKFFSAEWWKVLKSASIEGHGTGRDHDQVRT
jgi:hypothetical protein